MNTTGHGSHFSATGGQPLPRREPIMAGYRGTPKALLKGLYRSVPMKQELYTLLKKVYQPRPNIYRHLYFQGIITVQVDGQVSFKMKHYGYQLENEVFWDGLMGRFEKESISLWIELCKRSRTIMDVGANTGIYALSAKAVNEQADVYAFEPVKRVYDKLVFNCRLNEFQIHCEEKAISNRDGSVQIFDVNQEHVYAASLNRDAAHLSSDRTSIVESVTLDSFVKAKKLSNIDLVKIDVETHEPEVLEGFAEHVGRSKPSILIEILSNEIAERVEVLTREGNYLYFSINERSGPVRVERLIREKDPFEIGNYNFLLCTPAVAQSLNL
jgi:FkbM family methyltransferase